MKLRKSAPILLLATAMLSGCAVQHYRPAPIVPAKTAAELENRSLSDPGLREYVGKTLGHPVSWPMRQWNLRTLTLAALYFNPQMAIARDQIAVAQGAIVTAAEHPNPTLKLTPGIPSPYLLNLRLRFPIETHGKRNLRIEQARHLSSAAGIALAEAAWTVASNLRRALLAYRMAKAELALSRATGMTEARQITLLEQRLAAGEGARPALDAADLALSNIRFATSVDEGQVATTRAALAGAIGIPVSALNGLELTWPNFERLPSLASLSPRHIQRDAVLNRLDVHRALEQYAAADAALRLQIALQYPDFDIGSGYSYSEPNSNFTIPFSLILPLRNHNQGPIAQAEALRKEAAANFLAVQARAIAQSQQALAAYRSALAELDQAGRPLENQGRQVRTTRSAVAAGESDRLQLNTLLLEGPVYAQQHLQALAQAQAALGALEDAVEKPLGPDAVIFSGPVPASAARGRKESGQ
ncbi:MAG TPA: TolC family protein [Patescibacteria group bacterium]|nr:TolC family protein [Patescibacteria group bacterium]